MSLAVPYTTIFTPNVMGKSVVMQGVGVVPSKILRLFILRELCVGRDLTVDAVLMILVISVVSRDCRYYR